MKSFKYIFTLTILILGIFLTSCSDNNSSGPNSNSDVPNLQAVLDDGLNQLSLVGVSAAIMDRNGNVWRGVSGYSDPASKTAIKENMILGIGSTTKPFTAAIVLQLVEEGMLSLEDSVGKWLQLSHPNIDNSATVRQLLNMSSGIYDFTEEDAYDDAVEANLSRIWSLEDIFPFVQAPYFSPGGGWGYSNTNYTLLGMMIEKVTQKSYATLLRERISDPLGLRHTSFEPMDLIAGELATPWDDINDDEVLDDLSGFARQSTYSSAHAAGAIMSTAEETAKSIHAIFDGTLLNQSSLAQMKSYLQLSPEIGYGLGVFRIATDGYVMWGHGGEVGGFTSIAFYFPDRELTVSILVNQYRDDPLGDYVPLAIALLEEYN